MGYCTYGGGCLRPKTGVVIPDELLDELSEHFDDECDFSPDGGLSLCKSYCKDYEIEDVLLKLAPFIECGSICMTGEDDEHWRYRFQSGQMYIENGEVVYIQERRTINVQYYDPEGAEDETQFDIEDNGASFVEMFNEVIKLFAQFCSETYGSAQGMCEIFSVYEVPYDGDKEEK